MIHPESPSSPKGDDIVAGEAHAARRRGRLRFLLGAPGSGHALSSFCQPWLAGAFWCFALSGCTVVAVGAAAVSVTATAVGAAADVAVGTAKLAGKGVGKAYDALTDDKPDNSGVSVKFRESDPNHPYQPGPGVSNNREPFVESETP